MTGTKWPGHQGIKGPKKEKNQKKKEKLHQKIPTLGNRIPLCDHVHQYLCWCLLLGTLLSFLLCNTKTSEAGYRWKAPLDHPKQMERREFALLLGRWVSACWYDTSHLPKSKLIQLFFVPVIDSKLQKRVCEGYVSILSDDLTIWFSFSGSSQRIAFYGSRTS